MNPRDIHDILTRLEEHELRAARVLNMVPSENSMSALAKLPMLLDLSHRYFFNDGSDDEPWEFRGVQELAGLETDLARSLLRDLTGAELVNLRALSGLNLMTLTLSALGGPPGSTVMLLSRDQGGHYATASVAGRLGLEVCYATGPDPHSIDAAQVMATLEEHEPGLIYIDQSNSLFPLDVAALVGAVRQAAPRALVHIDASHWMGLILGRQLTNPLDAGADSFGGSTHKTFPGPHKAVFATNRADIAARFRATQKYMVSSHHFGAGVSLALALLEFQQCGGQRYAAQIIQNARALGAALDRRGLDVAERERGFTGGHQLWIRTRTSGVDAFIASRRLFDAGIRTNAYASLPGIPEPVLRVGVNEATYHGLVEADMETLAGIFTAAVSGARPAAHLAEQTAALRARYRPAYRFAADDPRLFEHSTRVMRLALAQSPVASVAAGAGRGSAPETSWSKVGSMKILPFTDDHLEPAAALLAQRHRAHKQAVSALPERSADPAEALRAVQAVWQRPRTSGVAAIDSGRVVAFLLGTITIDTLRGRSGWIRLAGHALAPDTGPELYRDLYAELAARWVEAGCFAHYAMIPATDRDTLDAWYGLGFGHEQVHAAQWLDELAIPDDPIDPGPAIDIRRATLGDLPALVDASGLVARYQTASPVFGVFLPEFAEDWPQDYRELLEDDANRVWIATHEGRLLGYQIFSPPEPGEDDLLTAEGMVDMVLAVTRAEWQGRGLGRALFARGVQDVLDLGYRCCQTDWRAANLQSSRFWPRLGFLPTVYRMFRHVDERIAWARGDVIFQE